MQGSRGFIHREARRPISPLDSRPASSRMQTAARHLSMMTGDETDWPFVTRSTAALSLSPSLLPRSLVADSFVHTRCREEGNSSKLQGSTRLPILDSAACDASTGAAALDQSCPRLVEPRLLMSLPSN